MHLRPMMALFLLCSTTLFASCATTAKPDPTAVRTVVEVAKPSTPPELIDCKGPTALPDIVRGDPAGGRLLALWLAKNYPSLVECGSDAEAMRKRG